MLFCPCRCCGGWLEVPDDQSTANRSSDAGCGGSLTFLSFFFLLFFEFFPLSLSSKLKLSRPPLKSSLPPLLLCRRASFKAFFSAFRRARRLSFVSSSASTSWKLLLSASPQSSPPLSLLFDFLLFFFLYHCLSMYFLRMNSRIFGISWVSGSGNSLASHRDIHSFLATLFPPSSRAFTCSMVNLDIDTPTARC